jgi:uncharacterized protein (DUF1499 family)
LTDSAPLRIRPCPRTPNCVSTVARGDRHRVEPIRFTGPLDEAAARLRRAVESLPRTRVVTAEPGYLAAEVRSAVFRFVDDLEAELVAGGDGEEGGVIHLRSASRLGRSDFGVNRRRIEQLRQAFAAEPG